ncbi:MAG: hypothetical protein ACE5NM_06040 [Sedimentisphaerales bacterium]
MEKQEFFSFSGKSAFCFVKATVNKNLQKARNRRKPPGKTWGAKYLNSYPRQEL